MQFLILLLKIPLLMIHWVGIINFVVLKMSFNTVEAECISCKQNAEKQYVAKYRYNSIVDSVIEEVEVHLIYNHPIEVGEFHKLLIKKNGTRKVEKYENIYCAIAWILSPLILIISL